MSRTHKRSGSHSRLRKPSRPTKAHSVKDLLARAAPSLSHLADQSDRQAFWQRWLASHVPDELASRVCGVVERAGTLTVFAESSAWAARLRYAVRELESEVRTAAPAVAEIHVRVLPRAGK